MKPTFLIASASIALASTLLACTSPAPPAAPTQTAAKPVSIQDSCIDPTRIQAQKVISDQEIQFTLAGKQVWTNHLAHVCPGLKAQGGFSWEVTGSMICSNKQTIFVLDRDTPCQLGEFSRLPPTAS